MLFKTAPEVKSFQGLEFFGLYDCVWQTNS